MHLLAAIEKHAVLFFPSGTYRVSRPLMLKPDTALIGLNPATTQISLIDGSPAFGGEGAPVGIIVAPKDGTEHRARARHHHGQLQSAGGGRDLDGRKEFVAGRCFFSRPAVLRFWLSRVRVSASTAGRRAAGSAELRVFARRGGSADHERRRRHLPQQLATWHEREDRTSRGEHRHAREDLPDVGRASHAGGSQSSTMCATGKCTRSRPRRRTPPVPTPMRWISKTPEDLLFANTYMYRVSRNVLPKTYAIVTRRSDGYRFRKRESVQPDAARIRQRGLQRSQWRLRAFAFLHAIRGECGCEATR